MHVGGVWMYVVSVFPHTQMWVHLKGGCVFQFVQLHA